MRQGVFANQSTSSGFIIGECMGRLYPSGFLLADDKDVFMINEIAEVTAKEFGNFTRFVNRHCTPNVTVQTGMYDKHQVVLYVSNREIKAGK